jgi:SAM-dependent methyltransferase
MPGDTAQHHHHQHQHDQPHLSTKALAAWETIAGYWDRTISRDGNNYWQRLQEPCLARFLPEARVRGCRALDLATGNGLVARWLVARGARRVLATDGSENMIRIARGYWEAAGGGVSGEGAGAGAGAGAGEQEKGKEGDGGEMAFRVVDVTREEDLRGLVADGERGFDVIVMNMAIMDVATIEPLAKVLSAEGGLLAKDGV